MTDNDKIAEWLANNKPTRLPSSSSARPKWVALVPAAKKLKKAGQPSEDIARDLDLPVGTVRKYLGEKPKDTGCRMKRCR